MSPDRTPPRTLIIGAGLAGLTLANRLHASSAEHVMIVEKSRGVGGRMATRRTDHAKFDHGAQFYSLKPPIEKLHATWLAHSLATPWFQSHGVEHFKCANGMTALAKDLAARLDIKFETRVLQISNENAGWKVRCEGSSHELNRDMVWDRLVLTCPLPQSLEILRQSEITYDVKLDSIAYAKAVVGLVEVETMAPELTGGSGYREIETGKIFSIADQYAKGLSAMPALTVVLKPEFSDANFEQSDRELSDMLMRELKALDVTFSARSVQIKKWRLAHPLSTASSLYDHPRPGLFLAGDAFGGPSLNGAVRSATALADFLQT